MTATEARLGATAASDAEIAARLTSLVEHGRWREMLALAATCVSERPLDPAWTVSAIDKLVSYHIVSLPLLRNALEPARLDLSSVPTGRPPYETLAIEARDVAAVLADDLFRRPALGVPALVACGRLFETRDDPRAGEVADRLAALPTSPALAHFRARLLAVAGRHADGALALQALRPEASAPAIVPIASRLPHDVPSIDTIACGVHFDGVRYGKSFQAPNTEPDCDEFRDVELVGRFFFPVDTEGVAHVDGLVSEPENVFGMASLEPDHWRHHGRRAHVATWSPGALMLDVPRRRARHFDAALLLGTAYADNYFHWLLEVLPRLAVLPHLPNPGRVALLVGHPLRRWQAETLTMLGIDAERVVTVAEDESVTCGTLWAPSTATTNGLVTPFAAEFVRERLGRRGARRRKIYCPRASGMRHVLNDGEIARAAVARGYELFDPTHMTVADQVRLFSDAAVVAGPTGAALANAVFAPEGAQLVVLNARAFVFSTYVSQAHVCGQGAHVAIGIEREMAMLQRHWDYAVDPRDVIAALDAAESALAA